MDIVHAASRVWRPQGDCVNEREAVKKCLWMRSPWPATTSYSDEKSLWMSSHTSLSYPDTSAQPKADQRMPGSIWIRYRCWWGGWQISLALKLRKETQNRSNLWCSLEQIPPTWIRHMSVSWVCGFESREIGDRSRSDGWQSPCRRLWRVFDSSWFPSKFTGGGWHEDRIEREAEKMGTRGW